MVKTGKKSTGKKHSKKALKTKSIVKEKKRKLPAAVVYSSHQIPHGYNIDTIVIMPVNIDTSFIYWEITDRLLKGKKRKLKTGSAQLIVKVFEANFLREVCSFEAKERIGKNYINYQPSFKPLIAEIGISNGSGFVGLLKSGTVSSPSWNPSAAKKSPLNPPSAEKKDTLKTENSSTNPSVRKHEIWMTKTEDKCEIVRVPFSKKVAKDAEIMKYYQKTVGQHKSPLFSRT
jgi:hypothetical protein